ncbi:MAG TPA: DMT family transporter, partial [bacterium]
AALFGASTPASKYVLSGVGPVTLAGLLYLGSAIAVLPFSFNGGNREIALRSKNLLRMLGAVVFGGGLGPIFLLLGLKLASAATVSLWLNLESVGTAILAWLFFREHIHKRTMFAILLVVVAGIILVAPSNFGNLRSIAFVALACLCWGADNNLTSIIDGFTPQQTTLIKGIVAGSVNLIIGLSIEGGQITGGTIMFSMLIGAFSYGVSIVLYIMGAQKLGAVRSQMLFATSPFIGVGIAWLILGEAVTLPQVVASLIMIGGLWLMLTEKHEHHHEHEWLEHIHLHSHEDDHHLHEHPSLPPGTRHIHPHVHLPHEHAHAHEPDLHHRHDH